MVLVGGWKLPPTFFKESDVKRLKQRLKEPSTYAGLAILGSLFGVKEVEAFGAPEVGVALAGLAAMFLGEGTKDTEEKK